LTLPKYHVSKRKNEPWRFKQEGAKRVIATADTKAEAMEKMRDFMHAGHEGSVRIHKEKGAFQEERTYPRAKDPMSSPG